MLQRRNAYTLKRTMRGTLAMPGHYSITPPPENPPDPIPANDPPPEPASKTDDVPEWVRADPAKAYEAIRAVRKEAERYRKLLREREQAEEQAKKTAELEQGNFKSLYEQAEAEKARLAAELAKRDAEQLRVRIASEVGIPLSWASRLKGETEEELKQDALSLKADIPPVKSSAGSTTTPVPGGQPVKETDEQRRQRLRGGGSNIFATNGGVSMNRKKG